MTRSMGVGFWGLNFKEVKNRLIGNSETAWAFRHLSYRYLWGFLFICLFFLFLAWGILVPWPGIKPMSPAVEVQSSNYWITREFPVLQVVLVVKSSPANAGDIRDTGSILGPGRSPGEGHGNSLQYSCLDNSMTEESGKLQSMVLQRVRHDWATQHTQRLANSSPYYD